MPLVIAAQPCIWCIRLVQNALIALIVFAAAADLVLEEIRQQRRRELAITDQKERILLAEAKKLQEAIASGKLAPYMKPIRGKDGKIIERPTRPVSVSSFMFAKASILVFYLYNVH